MAVPTPPDNFLRIAEESDFEPGTSRQVRFLGRTIRIERDREGRFSALDLVCRHQNMSLAGAEREPTTDGEIVTCPAHGWRYHLPSGACLTEPWARLRRRAVRVTDGHVYLAILPMSEDHDREV